MANLSASRVSDKKLRNIRIFQSNIYFSLDYLNSTIKKVEKLRGKITRQKIKLKNKKEQLKMEIISFVNSIRKKYTFQDYRAREALKLALIIAEKVKNGSKK